MMPAHQENAQAATDHSLANMGKTALRHWNCLSSLWRDPILFTLNHSFIFLSKVGMPEKYIEK